MNTDKHGYYFFVFMVGLGFICVHPWFQKKELKCVTG